ncbi:MAG: hypothetical protein QOH61_161, partial [Chloroflexota bacterium]|nr:hypothetical protein [Chloroflexota bacterium]
AAEDRRIQDDRDFARRATAIDERQLGTQDRITREMIAWSASVEADFLESRLEEFGADPIHGPQTLLPVRIAKLPLPSAEVAEAMIPKYHAIAAMYRQTAERHREGVANGRTPARFAVTETLAQLDALVASPPEQDPLLGVGEPVGIPDPAAWLGRLGQVIADDIRPAMATFRDTLRDEVLPQARPDERCGLTWLADGAEAYERAIRLYTTLPLTAQEIHDVGLAQVESLAAEYRALGPEVTGSSDLGEVLEALRSDPALHHTNAADVVSASQAALAKAKAAMPQWFGILPKADCEVEAATTGALAYYFSPPEDGSRGGVFFMNTAVPSDWGRYQIEATAYHEGIPGHHLQLSIASELKGVPEFRKRAFIAAYGEGWGLYTERLADEMGLYSTPLDRMGMLCADSMRACRLVVDTGMHALGWSREQAVQYMIENSPMRDGQVRAEIDRYAVTPGQALAYMIGRLEIQRIRAEAEATLGDRFDIRAFHDAVLGSGLMPLPTLDRFVREWALGQA